MFNTDPISAYADYYLPSIGLITVWLLLKTSNSNAFLI